MNYVSICDSRGSTVQLSWRHLGNANPAGIFQTWVYGFDGLQTRVPSRQPVVIVL